MHLLFKITMKIYNKARHMILTGFIYTYNTYSFNRQEFLHFQLSLTYEQYPK